MISETGFFSQMLTPNHESLKKPGFLVRAPTGWVRGGFIEIIVLRLKIRAIAPLY
jgi:hypothetical protein